MNIISDFDALVSEFDTVISEERKLKKIKIMNNFKVNKIGTKCAKGAFRFIVLVYMIFVYGQYYFFIGKLFNFTRTHVYVGR